MANNFGSTNGKLLAQMVLSNMIALPVFSKISTNFSGLHNGQRAKFNQDVDVRLISAGTVEDYSAGYAAADSTDTNATVTIDKHKHISRNLTVEEAFSRDGTVLAGYAALDANALANKVLLDLCGLVVNPGVPTATQQTVVAVGAFGHDSVVDVNVALDGRDVPDIGRFGVLNSLYHGALRKDSTIIANNINNGSDAVSSGIITNVDGVEYMKYSKLPDNSENLTGFVGTQDSLALATMLPDIANLPDAIDIPMSGKMSVATDPSGLSVLVVEEVDLKDGVVYTSIRLMYGVGLGLAGNIQKIASA